MGDAGVGKSSIILRYTNNEFNASLVSSIGVDFKSKDILINNQKIKIQIWDTAGHERFRTITTSYYRGAHTIVIVFDLSSRVSFEHIDNWLEQINKYAKENVLKYLVGNKSDLVEKREVSTEEAKSVANKYNIPYIETSAKNSTNINDMFLTATNNYLLKYNFAKEKEYQGVSLNTKMMKNKKKNECC